MNKKVPVVKVASPPQAMDVSGLPVEVSVVLADITAMLGHRSMRMTLVYARIADRTVADQYFAAANTVDQLYTQPNP